MPYGGFDTLSEFTFWLDKTAQENQTKLYVICESQSLRPIGLAGYLRITPEHGSIENRASTFFFYFKTNTCRNRGNVFNDEICF